MGNTLQTPPQTPQQQEKEEAEQQQQQQQQSSNDDVNQHEFTCEICIEPTSYRENKFKNGDKCSHPYCTDCMTKYIAAKLDDGSNGRIDCPSPTCAHTLDPDAACASLVGASLFVRWCDALCEDAVSGLEKCYCPYANCGELIVDECGGGGSKGRKSKCPRCGRLICFGCKRSWHAGFGCDEMGEVRDGNDVAFGRLAEVNKWMRCPRCRHFVERLEGCRIVKCRCRISFCYKCGKQVEKHYCDCSLVSGQYEFYYIFCWYFSLFIFLVIMVALANTHKDLFKKWNTNLP